MEIRNIAIIAHVDHGKTTLVDQLLKQGDIIKEHQQIASRVMDSDAIERERGITILAKNTSIKYLHYKINVLDTPGHADFGGEVERIMKMVEGVLLLVDAYEGVMPQTKFVLKKALAEGLKPIVVINKIDREFSDPTRVINEVFDLFIDLGASEEQLDFPVVYASGLNGLSSFNKTFEDAKDMIPLFETIIAKVPAPQSEINKNLLFQPALIDYNDYVGKMGVGKINQGTMKQNETVTCIRLDGSKTNFRIQKIFTYIGLEKLEVKEAYAGDIVAISGLPDIMVGETIGVLNGTEILDPLHIDEPTVQMSFGINTSPLAGKEGKYVTASKLEERLYRETQKDVSLRVEPIGGSDNFMVSGRGELHLGILIENMRREGYEFQVSRPRVIIKEIDGVKCEPYEDVTVECPTDSLGNVIELFGNRNGELGTIEPVGSQTRLHYVMPSRGLIGLMTLFMTSTKGYGILNHIFLEYRKLDHQAIGSRKRGSLVSMNSGLTTAYAIGRLEDRGEMFVEPRTLVYEGMVVGENNKDNDLVVNVVQAKQLTNHRSAGKDNTVVLKKPRQMDLEACLAFINDDELVEITPKSIRVRKQHLNPNERKKNRE